MGVTAINENDVKSAITTPHPNPSDKFSTVGYVLKGNPMQYTLELYSMLGKKINAYTFKSKTGLMVIPTDELQNGIYFCTLKQNDKTVSTQKLIVSHK